MKLTITGYFAAVAILAGATSAQAGVQFAVSTDRTSYTGTVTKYNTLADAQAGQNSVGSWAIPDRITDAPYNTAYRDLGLFVVQGMPSVYADCATWNSAWWYTTNPASSPYSGSGNPNNVNSGFLQLYDDDSSTVASANGSFGGWNGTHYTTFNLQVSGANATYDPAVSPNDWARLWAAPATGGPAASTVGTFLSYSLDATFSGLEGVVAGSLIEANNHPTGVAGTFTALFQNRSYEWLNGTVDSQGKTRVIDPDVDGFYVVDFTLGMDNWAFGNSDSLNGAFADSYFAQVPEPATMALFGLGGLAAFGGRLRRKFARKAKA